MRRACVVVEDVSEHDSNSSLKHARPRAPPPVDPPSDAECAILMEPLPPDEPAWSPEIVDDEGNVKVEEMHFYGIVALAKWLVTHDTTPLSRGEVGRTGKRASTRPTTDGAGTGRCWRGQPSPPAPGAMRLCPGLGALRAGLLGGAVRKSAFGPNGVYNRLARYYDRHRSATTRCRNAG